MSSVLTTSVFTAPMRMFQGLNELRARQPQLANAALVSLLAILPCLVAMAIDERTVNGIDVWIKPTKFFASLAVYFATLAWAFGYLPRDAQFSRTGRFVVGGALAAATYEMAWILFAAANGVPSHFNFSSPAWIAAYGLAGAGSVVLIAVILAQGIMIARQRAVPVAPVLRWALLLGAIVAFTCTLVVAGFLSMHKGHWVGGTASDVAALPILGWSRTGGDLRVAHFWSLHAQQFIPALGWLLAARGRTHATRTVSVFAAAYVALIVFTFVQALRGEPFLAFLH
jgi:hypothetical protein